MKYVTFFTLICVLLSAQFLPAQAPDTLWTKTFGGVNSENGYSVQQTTDGGYIIVGSTTSFGAGGTDVWFIKTNSSGDNLWTKTYGGIGFDWGFSVQQTTDGGYIIVGETLSFGAGEMDVWLIKTNSPGDTLWTKTFGGNDFDSGNSIQQTTDGGYIIVGDTKSFGASYRDVWLIRTNSLGDTLWTKTYGGISPDYGNSIQQTTDGGYIIVGSTMSFGAGSTDVWLIKTNSSGDNLWTKTFGGISSDKGRSVQQTTDGGYIIVGETWSFGAGEEDVWLIKTNESGDTVWTKIYGGSSSDIGYSVQQTSNGGYIILAQTGSYGSGSYDMWLIRTDESGDTLWTKTYGGLGFDWGYSVQQTTDGGYIIVGETSFGAGGGDVWVIKTTPDITNIEQSEDLIPFSYSLQQNYPNPFNPSTTIEFDLPKSSQVTLKIFNILGEEIATLVSDRLSVGSYSYEWSRPAGIASGVYLYRLETKGFEETKKMILMK